MYFRSDSTLKKGSNHQDRFSGKTGTVRCIDEDFCEEYSSPWKGNVEPGTYRYIPNNGYYRKHKNCRNDVKDVVSLKKKGERTSASVPLDVRQAQKSLKRDLDHHFKGEEEQRIVTPPPKPPTARVQFRNVEQSGASTVRSQSPVALPRPLFRNQALAQNQSHAARIAAAAALAAEMQRESEMSLVDQFAQYEVWGLD